MTSTEIKSENKRSYTYAGFNQSNVKRLVPFGICFSEVATLKTP